MAMASPVPETPGPDWPVIALVASAGGVEATSAVVGALPASLPAAVLVLVHQSPDRASLLGEILSRRAALPVRDAEHGMRLAPGRILVAPAAHHVLVTPDGVLALIPSGPPPPSRPSADLLLTTLAVAMRDRAVAVVLSGGGRDGATGASAVHVFGGMVLATDEGSSAVFSMPAATIERDDTVDHVVDLDDVAGLLVGLATAPRLSPG
jgi:two-component system chemotaxis response regulator CheB